MSSITLNDQQQSALEAMEAFICSDDDLFVLKGFAGTGKSTTIQFLLNRLNNSSLGGKVVFTAPTHKAVKVLRRMAENYAIEVECLTIHSLLSLKVVNQGDKQQLKPQKKQKDPMRDVALVVIDECSMIGQALYEHIIDSLKFNPVKYIFMGDPAQLPPVNEKNSQTFEQPQRRSELTQIMRQRGENPILGVCTDIREAWARGDSRLPAIIPQMAEDGSVGVSVLMGELFTEWMPSAFSHEQFDADPDRFRVIAWRNETVNKINAWIHQLRYPDCKTWLAEGEPVTFVKPLMNGMQVKMEVLRQQDEIMVQTDFEGMVLRCESVTHDQYPEIPCWILEVDVEGSGALDFYALDAEGIKVRDQALRSMAQHNKKQQKDPKFTGRVNWLPYYDLMQSFADVRPAYCMTAHKSQGSTFENVFVDVNDIWRNPNKIEALQCLYVACSRASHHLIVNAGGHA